MLSDPQHAVSNASSCVVTLLFNTWMKRIQILACDHPALKLQAESTSATNESVLKVALHHGKASGVIKPHDRVVVCQKAGDASVVKIIELED